MTEKKGVKRRRRRGLKEAMLYNVECQSNKKRREEKLRNIRSLMTKAWKKGHQLFVEQIRDQTRVIKFGMSFRVHTGQDIVVLKIRFLVVQALLPKLGSFPRYLCKYVFAFACIDLK